MDSSKAPLLTKNESHLDCNVGINSPPATNFIDAPYIGWREDFKEHKNRNDAAHCAAVLISDALHGRNMRHRMDAIALTINNIIRAKWYAVLYSITVILDLSLALLEIPSTFRQEGRHNRRFAAVWVTTLLEILCLCGFTLDVLLRYRFLGKRSFFRSRWIIAKVAFICLAFFNCTISAFVPSIPRFHRIFRPLMVAAHFRNVSKIFGNMLSSIPRVTNVSVLLGFHIAFWSVFAHLLFGGINSENCTAGNYDQPQSRCSNSRLLCSPFDKCCTDYFGTFGGALNQLFILLTTANFPDVMMPVYDCYPYASLFFIFYLMLGLYFIMNLILAVSYSIFQEKTKAKILEAVSKRVESLDAAYDLITRSGHFDTVTHSMFSEQPSHRSERFEKHNVEPHVPTGHQANIIRTGSSSVLAESTSTSLNTKDSATSGTKSTSIHMPYSVDHSQCMGGSSDTPRQYADTGTALSRSDIPSSSWTISQERDSKLESNHQAEVEKGNNPGISSTTGPAATGSSSLQPQRSAPLIAYNLRKSRAFGRIGLNTWRQLMGYLRSDLTPAQVDLLFFALDIDETGAISKEEFRDIATFIEVRFHKRKKGSKDEYLICKSETLLQLRRFLRKVALSNWFSLIFDGLILVNGLLIMCQFGVASDTNAYARINSVIGVLLWFFVAELIIKIVGLGLQTFLEDKFNILDLLVIPAATGGDIAFTYFHMAVDVAQKISYIRMVRLLRAFRALKGFGIIIKTFTSILPTFFRYMVVLVLVYYQFAVVGMEAFAGSIYYDPAPYPPFYVNATRLDERILLSAYYANNYWNNNFNTIYNAMITLFELMVVNNWAVTMMGHAYATSYWAMTYFYIWYFVMVIVVLNIVTAFLLDDFMVMRAQISDEDNGLVAGWKSRIFDVADYHGIDENDDWMVTRKTHPIHIYELMFADDIRAHLELMEAEEDDWEEFDLDHRTMREPSKMHLGIESLAPVTSLERETSRMLWTSTHPTNAARTRSATVGTEGTAMPSVLDQSSTVNPFNHSNHTQTNLRTRGSSGIRRTSFPSGGEEISVDGSRGHVVSAVSDLARVRRRSGRHSLQPGQIVREPSMAQEFTHDALGRICSSEFASAIHSDPANRNTRRSAH